MLEGIREAVRLKLRDRNKALDIGMHQIDQINNCEDFTGPDATKPDNWGGKTNNE